MTVHQPILVGPILEHLTAPFLREDARDAIFLDCTFGGGGHTATFLTAFEPFGSRVCVLAIDQDPAAIRAGEARFSREISQGRLVLVHAKISELFTTITPPIFTERPLLGILADLGFSSDQVEDGERGLSFTREGPLDMRLDPSRGHTALELMRASRESELADLIFNLGEERFSRRIAGAIKRAIGSGLLKTTRDLAEVVSKAVGGGARGDRGRIHPATRTFQALRIAVNNELEELDHLLNHVMLKLAPGGRVGIMSFHSLEDRKVKQAFRSFEGFQVLTKKPIEADEGELEINPRARSAKLRVAERLATE